MIFKNSLDYQRFGMLFAYISQTDHQWDLVTYQSTSDSQHKMASWNGKTFSVNEYQWAESSGKFQLQMASRAAFYVSVFCPSQQTFQQTVHCRKFETPPILAPCLIHNEHEGWGNFLYRYHMRSSQLGTNQWENTLRVVRILSLAVSGATRHKLTDWKRPKVLGRDLQQSL